MNADTQKKCKHYRISESEYKLIQNLLGRDPKGIEWALFSAMWSEHCSYKSSKNHLKKFYNKNARVLESEGENAGVVDLGFGERIAFKMESHNHPSFIEPYQGAATGVGGILRDIFTMGARPIALADYLCFGQASADRMSTLVNGVVRGIGGYGNCVGVPTVTGATEFHESYNKNILVNAMAVGLFRPQDKISLSKAKGIGNLVVYVGAKTGKDGVHGASMASESFDNDSEAKKPNVQIGDPFFEKLLIESCLEVMRQDLVVAIQDMGAAGLTSSTFEMASKGEVGMKIHLDKVPLRDSSMTPEEILLSESQERMLLVCEPKKLPALKKVFEDWGLDASSIGEITDTKLVDVYWHNECLSSIDPNLLVERAPRYERAYKAWQFKNQKKELNVLEPKPVESLKKYLSTAVGASKKWIYRQYDQRVGAKTAFGAEHQIAMLRLPDSKRGLAVSVGCRPHLMRLDARVGALDAIFYPTLQMAAHGAQVLAVTDCLNFGNPEKIEIMSEFVASVEAISEACKALDAPVVSGNVSFYNETLGENITSTPATGLIGLRENVDHLPADRFLNKSLKIYVLQFKSLQATGRVAELFNQEIAFSGDFQVTELSEFAKGLRSLCLNPEIKVSRVVGTGGPLVTLAKMSLGGQGIEINSNTLKNLGWDKQPFVETLYEVILGVEASFEDEFKKKLDQMSDKNPCLKSYFLGTTGEEQLVWGEEMIAVNELVKIYSQAWEKNFVLT